MPKTPPSIELSHGIGSRLWGFGCAFLAGLGWIGRLAAIGILGYCCFGSAVSGTSSDPLTSKPTRLRIAGWPWKYSVAEEVNFDPSPIGEDAAAKVPIFDVLYASESALAADIAIFGLITLSIIFVAKFFDRIRFSFALVLVALPFVVAGYFVYDRCIVTPGLHAKIARMLREYSGSEVEIERRYHSPTEVIFDRVGGIFYKNNGSQLPSRECVYTCRVQDADAKSVEDLTSLPLLKELTLVNCKVSELAVANLSKGIRLRKLVFKDCEINDETVDALESLPRMSEFVIDPPPSHSVLVKIEDETVAP